MYGAPNMAPVPVEVELTKDNNQVYVSTVNFLGTVNPVGTSTITTPVGVSSISVPVGVSSGVVGVSSLTIPVGVSSLSTPVAVSSGSINVSSINGFTVIGTGVSSDLWRA